MWYVSVASNELGQLPEVVIWFLPHTAFIIGLVRDDGISQKINRITASVEDTTNTFIKV